MLHHLTGYCKHKQVCRKRHVKEICENNSCEVYKCTFWNYGPCKFDPHAFFHKDTEISLWKLKKENDIFQKTIENIEKALKVLNEQEHDTLSNIENINEEKSKLDDKDNKLILSRSLFMNILENL